MTTCNFPPTRRLYDEDAYLRSFDATVLACTPREGDLYDAVLDATAFFPEQGGQHCDTGTLDDAPVLGVRLSGGVICHRTDRPLPVGESVHGCVDDAPRYEKMQLHTAEHILSGTMHRLYGVDNVGFHLSDTDMTLDTSRPLTEDMLREAERLANEAVFRNLPVLASYPGEKELSALSYRSKGEVSGPVRIVAIGDVDVCACCAPHVRATGEVGLIRILDWESHRGGLRLHVTAGRRALSDYRMCCDILREISALTSARRAECAGAVKRLLDVQKQTADRLRSLSLDAMRRAAKDLSSTAANAVVFFPELTDEGACAYAEVALPAVGGTLVLLTGEPGHYRYFLFCHGEAAGVARAAGAALCGKGGGRGNMARGVFAASEEQIRAYFGV